ncbi:MAG: dockerin type I repeat-containing protein, partial [Muribaculaceae bacterium]|nr:dockerin type I repeat-containing protein [Muribaculaceae bacterium]
ADNIFFYLRANNELVGANSINLSSGSSGYVSISYTPTSSGTNNLIVTGDRAGNEVYCTGSVNVEPLTEASLLVRSSVPAANASNQVAGNKLTLNASITNRKTSVYHDYIFARLYKKTLLGNVEEGEIQRVIEIPASNSQTTSSINQVFDFTNLSKGKYLVKFYYYSLDEEKMALQTATYEILGGVTGDVNGDGTVTAADVTALYDVLLNNDYSNVVNGDQNGDGNITSADVTAVYDVLLGN